MNKVISLDALQRLVIEPLKRLIENKTKKLESIDEGAQVNVQSDWNVNDPSSDAYVQNRPFYTSDPVETEILSTTLTSFDQYQDGMWYTAIQLETETVLTEGKTYKVIWNGVEYEIVAWMQDGTFGLGDKSLIDGSASTGEPFLIGFLDTMGVVYAFDLTSDEDIRTVSIIGYEPEIVTIPEKYIPDDLKGSIKMINNNPPDENGNINIEFQEEPLIFWEYIYDTGTACSHDFNGAVAFLNKNKQAPLENKNLSNVYLAEVYRDGATKNPRSASPAAWAGIFNGLPTAYFIKTNGGTKVVKTVQMAENGTVTIEQEVLPLVPWYNTANEGKVFGYKNGEYGLIDLVVDEALSNTSTNPVQNKVVTEALNAPKSLISMIDQVNGHKYYIEMRDGNLVSYCATTSIAITTMPTKIEYFSGEVFDPTGAVITATAEDGTTKEITNYTYSMDTLVEGQTSIEINYTEAGTIHTVSVPITIRPFTDVLVDFEYTDNGDGTYTITGWKGTYNGEPSTEMIIPNYENIIV